MLSDKNILIGICGGIAAYKTAELVRALKKESSAVRVMMTAAARQFIHPLTFETLSEEPVLTDLFGSELKPATVHIDWARWADLILICPATLNTIGKIANGIADNALTTTLLASQSPVLFCPAMNKAMVEHPAYVKNEKRLIDMGYEIVTPAAGYLACGEYGPGRLATKEEIVDSIRISLCLTRDLAGKRLLITAGPTRESIDPVRYLSNHSSGKMGYALAERARCRGAQVHLISGPVNLRPFRGVETTRVNSAEEMYNAVHDRFSSCDIFISAAAVSDYRAKEISVQKIKKEKGLPVIELTENPDILASLPKNRSQIVVGFSVETDDLVDHSIAKIKNKNLDFIVANNPSEEGAGFDVDTNKVTIIDKTGRIDSLPLMSKLEVADRILDRSMGK